MAEKSVLAVMAWHCHADGSESRPSHATIAFEVGCSTDTVARALSNLVKEGFLTVTRPYTQRRPAVYQCNLGFGAQRPPERQQGLPASTPPESAPRGLIDRSAPPQDPQRAPSGSAPLGPNSKEPSRKVKKAGDARSLSLDASLARAAAGASSDTDDPVSPVPIGERMQMLRDVLPPRTGRRRTRSQSRSTEALSDDSVGG